MKQSTTTKMKQKSASDCSLQVKMILENSCLFSLFFCYFTLLEFNFLTINKKSRVIGKQTRIIRK